MAWCGHVGVLHTPRTHLRYCTWEMGELLPDNSLANLQSVSPLSVNSSLSLMPCSATPSAAVWMDEFSAWYLLTYLALPYVFMQLLRGTTCLHLPAAGAHAYALLPTQPTHLPFNALPPRISVYCGGVRYLPLTAGPTPRGWTC